MSMEVEKRYMRQGIFFLEKKKKKGISKMEIIKKKKKRALLNALTTIPTIPTACRNLNREVKKTSGH